MAKTYALPFHVLYEKLYPLSSKRLTEVENDFRELAREAHTDPVERFDLLARKQPLKTSMAAHMALEAKVKRANDELPTLESILLSNDFRELEFVGENSLVWNPITINVPSSKKAYKNKLLITQPIPKIITNLAFYRRLGERKATNALNELLLPNVFDLLKREKLIIPNEHEKTPALAMNSRDPELINKNKGQEAIIVYDFMVQTSFPEGVDNVAVSLSKSYF